MTIQDISVEATIERVKVLIAEEKEMSPALKASLEVLLFLVPASRESIGPQQYEQQQAAVDGSQSAEEAQRSRRP